MSADEKVLLIAGLLYIAAVVLWALILQARGKAMLREIGGRADPELWRAVGAPKSLTAAMRDPQKLWVKFIRSGEYRQRLAPELSELVDDFRRRSNRMLIVCGAGGILLLIRFWPLLRTSFN